MKGYNADQFFFASIYTLADRKIKGSKENADLKIMRGDDGENTNHY